MSSIMEQMARKEAMLGGLMSMSSEDRDGAVRRIKAEAEKNSRFKKGELVRLCHSPGISLVGGIKALPHDHNDPKQHSYSRVLGWSCFGDIMVAIGYGTNPHCAECTWTDDFVQSLEGPDWKLGSAFSPDMELTFKWDQIGWDHRKINDVTRAKLVEAHIKQGDWFVEYEKPCGAWITRVVNERYFIQATK
jgi:hypothetical protein